MNLIPKLTITAMLFLAITPAIAHADVVPGAVLYLDASDNPDHDKGAWTNLGTAGGKLNAADTAPVLEKGLVQIASLGISEQREYYTAKESMQTFGGPVEENPQLFLGDWTLEILCKRNGNLFDQEHHLVGFQNTPNERFQGVRFTLSGNGEIRWSVHSQGEKRNFELTGATLAEGIWTWLTVVSANTESVVVYQNAVEVSRYKGLEFDDSLPIDEISIGANSHDERHRNFNGSFALVRVYDKALTAEEVRYNTGVIPLLFSAADPIREGSTFTLPLVVEGVTDLAGWKLDIAFDPGLLSAVSLAEGGFLKKDGANTHFDEGEIDNTAGTVTGLLTAAFGPGVDGTGELLLITFEAKAVGEGELELHNVQLGSSEGKPILHEFAPYPIVVASLYAAWDVNKDGAVNILDLTLVVNNFENLTNPRADINGDGIVNILDLILVAQHMGEGKNAAPVASFDSVTRDSLILNRTVVESLIRTAYAASDGSIAFWR